jgi:hypothetical protein
MWCLLFLWRRYISLCRTQACAKFSERDTLIVMDPVLKEIKFPHEGKVSNKNKHRFLGSFIGGCLALGC